MRAHPLLAALVAASSLLAGCAGLRPAATGPPPVEALLSPVLDVETLAEHTPIESFDGTVLDAWVYRPDVEEPVPVVINFSPYWSNAAPPAATGGDAFSQHLLDFFVPRGYAVALVSARGTGLSEGCFTIGGPTELRDADAVATFLGTQPWSNGNLAATGKSYDGTMAQGLLTIGNPHLKTIVPVSPISELYKYTYFDGVPYTNVHFNTYYVQLVSLQQSDDPTDPTYEKTPTRLCEESVDVQASQYHSLATGDYSPYWQVRNYTALLPERIDASVFYVHGLSDWNVKPDHMVPWIDALRARGVALKMWLGDWTHEYPTRSDFNVTLLRWLDHFLKGVDTGILAEPLVQVEDRSGAWRHEDAWPPARAAPLRLHLDAAGALGPEPGSGSSAYPDRPAAGAPVAPPLPGAQERLVFRSEPLAEDLRLAGAPVLHALVSSTGPRGTLSATLYADDVVVDQGFLDLAHRDSLAQGTPMPPGETAHVTVKFYPQDAPLPKGSVLTLVVSHDPPADAPVGIVATPTGALVTLHHGEATFLEVPVVPLADARLEDPQPDDVGCWAC